MLRVLSIPSAHPYVARVLPARAEAAYPSVPEQRPSPVETDGVVRLPDPAPGDEEPRPGVWWPHRALDAAWLDEHADAADVVHLHFGFEGRTTDQLRGWLDVLDRHVLPLVLTVHDLDNPHLLDQAHHGATLDLLVPRAARVLTLTPTAADEVRRRWGVEALVVSHPQIVDDETILAVCDAHDGPPRIGLSLGSLRAGTDPRAWFGRLVAAAAAHGAMLDILANDEVRETQDGRRAAILADLAPVRFVPRMSDPELHAWVAGLDVAVLPYRHGTHSGWLEMCWDLGTPVLAPRVGHLAAQHTDGRVLTFDPASGDGLEDALAALLAAGRDSDPTARLAARRALLAEVVAAHERVYAEVVGR